MNPVNPLIQSLESIASFFRKMNEYDNPDVNRAKAAKYESLIALFHLSANNPPKMAPAFKERLLEISQKYTELAKRDPSSIDYLDLVRSLYRDYMIPFLRAIVTDDADPDVQKFAQHVCYALHTENDLSLNTEIVLSRFRPNEMAPNLLARLKEMKSAIDLAPSSEKAPLIHRLLKSLRDHYDQGFNPINSGNPVQVFSFMAFFGGRLKVLAMGSPTIQTAYLPLVGKGEASIDPLFIGYLEQLDRKQERHLYLSFQDMDAEGARNLLLMDIQSSEKFGKCFLAITCSKNSPFYFGEGHPEDRDEFVEMVHRQFFGLQNTGCYLPASLNDCEGQSKRLLLLLKDLLLSAAPSLEERLALIDFYYVLFASWICLEKKVDYINFTCKDAIDRGMQSLAEFTLFWSTVQGNIVETERFAERMEQILFARAYYVRKRSMLTVRFDRFISNANQFLLKLQDPERKEAFCRKVRELFKLEGLDVASIH